MLHGLISDVCGFHCSSTLRKELAKKDPVEVFASYWMAALCKLHKELSWGNVLEGSALRGRHKTGAKPENDMLFGSGGKSCDLFFCCTGDAHRVCRAIGNPDRTLEAKIG